MLPLKDSVPARTFPLVNYTLIGLNILCFLIELKAGARGWLQELINTLGVVPARFLAGPDAREFLTLFSSMFLHGGWLHLFSNMWALYIFGDNVEDRMGPVRYLIFYLVCGIAAGLTQVFFTPNSMVPGIGASGAIAGVLGAYLLLFPKARVITLIPIFFFPYIVELPAVVYLGFWFLLQLWSGSLAIVHSAYTADEPGGGIAYWAHIGGFVAGAILVWLFAVPQRSARRRFADEYQPW